MKLPLSLGRNNGERIDKLESRIEELEDERDRWKNRFEAEKDRRSELSRKKQEAEKELKILKQREREDSERESNEQEVSNDNYRELEFNELKSSLQRLNSVVSGSGDLVTVYSPSETRELSDLTVLKNSVNKQVYNDLAMEESFVAFVDPVLGAFVFRLSPFFSEKVDVEERFDIQEILDFVESEKYWCLVSAGKTEIFREKNGDYELVEKVKSRVDREHSKGGFSQDRFERKRDEQIKSHINKVGEKLEEFEKVYLLGNQRICDDLPGVYLGGFDPNRRKPEQFYRCRVGVFF